MDTNLLQAILSLPELYITKVKIESTKILICCESLLAEKPCPVCLEKCKKINQVNERIIRDLPITGKEVYLHIISRQFKCENCNRYFYEQFDFVKSNRYMTTRLEQYLYQCCKDSSLKEVAVRENVLWDVLEGVFNREAKLEIRKRNKPVVRRIGIDEIAARKGKRDYITIITNLDTSTVIDVLDFRTKPELIAYFKAKGTTFCEAIEAFSCDMFEGFSSTAKQVFPNADIIIDRFHLFVHLNNVLDIERKSLKKTYANQEHLKSIKWTLFKHWKDLTSRQKNILLKVFRVVPKLRELYFTKNELVNIFNQDISIEEAKKLIDKWMEQAKTLKNEHLDKFITMVYSWKNYIYPFFKWRISNGIVEGINNAIKTLKRVAYGFRNFENFRLRIIVKFS